MNYEYKEKEKNNGLCVSIRDRGENSLLEAKIKGNNVIFVTNVRKNNTSKCLSNSSKKCSKLIGGQ